MPGSERRLITASERRLLTVLFTDIVGSTDLAVEMGDARWRELIARHHRIVRGELRRFGGREIDTAGDGFFATFDRPAQAIRCAAGVVHAVRELGIEVRAGLHLGEVEVAGKNVGGVSVHAGARVLAAADPGEILVSATLRELVAGSGLEFADRGQHTLRGVPGTWQLFGLEAVDGRALEPVPDPPTAAERRAAIAAPTILRRSRVPAAIAALVVLLLVAAVLTRSSDRSPRANREGEPQIPPLNTVVNVDPTSETVLHTTTHALQAHGGGNPKIVVGEGGVWVRSRNLVHIDPATGEIEGDPLDPLEISVIDPLADRGVEVGYRAVWIGGLRSANGVALLRWDPATNEPLAATRVPTDSPLTDVALGYGSVWLAFVDGRVFRLEAETTDVEATIPVGGSLDGVVVGADGVWALDIANGTLTRVDPRTEEVGHPTELAGSILAMAADDDRVWLLDAVGHVVIPIDPAGVKRDPIPVGSKPSGIAVGLGSVWVCDEGGDVYQIDPLTKQTNVIHVGGRLTAIAVDEDNGTLWIAVGGD
jgi:class 3 adenylate cyclase/streptogramin lyase